MFYVYIHRRSDTGTPFYVGKGKGARARVEQHRNPFWRAVAEKACGYAITFAATGLDEELALLAEMELISKLRALGHRLTNLTDGGEGMTGHKFAPDVVERRARAQRGQQRPSVSAKLKGRAKSTEHRAALSLSKTGTKASEDARRRMSQTRKGRPSTMLGKRHSAESREKTRNSLLALPRKTCPHCGVCNLDPGNAAKLHFDRCKEKT